MARTLVVISAGLSIPSSTRMLADRITGAVQREVTARGESLDVEVVELRTLAREIADHLVSGMPPCARPGALGAVSSADAVVAVTPVFTASYSGLFKSFVDLLDNDAMASKPVLIAATAGTPRHSLVLDHALRPLFSYLRAVVVPTGVFAATVPSWLPEVINWKLSDEYHAPIAVGGHVRIYTATELTAKLRAAGLDPAGHHRAHALHSPYWWLKCAVGVTNDDHPLVTRYKKFLEWDIIRQPRSTRVAERVLSPVLGKSFVVYARKPSTHHVVAA